MECTHPKLLATFGAPELRVSARIIGLPRSDIESPTVSYSERGQSKVHTYALIPRWYHEGGTNSSMASHPSIPD